MYPYALVSPMTTSKHDTFLCFSIVCGGPGLGIVTRAEDGSSCPLPARSLSWPPQPSDHRYQSTTVHVCATDRTIRMMHEVLVPRVRDELSSGCAPSFIHGPWFLVAERTPVLACCVALLVPNTPTGEGLRVGSVEQLDPCPSQASRTPSCPVHQDLPTPYCEGGERRGG